MKNVKLIDAPIVTVTRLDTEEPGSTVIETVYRVEKEVQPENVLNPEGGKTGKDIDDDVAIRVILQCEKALSKSSTGGEGCRTLGSGRLRNSPRREFFQGLKESKEKCLQRRNLRSLPNHPSQREQGQVKGPYLRDLVPLLEVSTEGIKSVEEQCASKRFLSLVRKVENLNAERFFKKQLEECECVRRKCGIGSQSIISDLISAQ
ncbi:hypothetical protein HAX54_032409 [Datura stramonium]|uniref:Uncharacterized protein n=1 Tax=Datura stramonium TaxID=4076 RepID=A0ABS8SCS1_DATST|nr:hypothetical protein [Datura stramonium]